MKDAAVWAQRSQERQPTQCPKLRYRTKAIAAQKAVFATRRCGEEIRPYKCDDCKAWHIGHAVPRKYRQGAAS